MNGINLLQATICQNVQRIAKHTIINTLNLQFQCDEWPRSNVNADYYYYHILHIFLDKVF